MFVQYGIYLTSSLDHFASDDDRPELLLLSPISLLVKVTPYLTPQAVNVITSAIYGGIGILGVARHIFQVKDLHSKQNCFSNNFSRLRPKIHEKQIVRKQHVFQV